ncbi:hypothetical protein FRC11_006452 [Ceratobasidium sp. 423]|nr:hypothetical protein FRC11_006452 [Ceratobasidium sp. 423]
MAQLLTKAVYDVSGRIAPVAGGGTGIGLMISRALAVNGAKVYVGSRRNEVVEETADEHGSKLNEEIIPIELDVTDKSSIKNAVQVIQKSDGKLDLPFNKRVVLFAGRSGPKSPFFVDETTPENEDSHTFGS